MGLKKVSMNKNDLIKTARLACLSLSEKEKQTFTDQLKLVFEYFNKVSAVDTKNTEPLIYPLEGIEGLSEAVSTRPDIINEIQNQEQLLNLAPERFGDEYKVPPVVE